MLTPLCPCAPAVQLNKAFQAEESPGVIYCISMQWFREWEAFVKGKDNGESSRAPAPAGQGPWAVDPRGVGVSRRRRRARVCAGPAGVRCHPFRCCPAHQAAHRGRAALPLPSRLSS